MKYSLYNSKWITGEYQPEVVAYYFRKWENFHTEFHWHDQIEIMYVINGKCIIETPSDSFILAKGEFILIDAGVPHKLVVDKDVPCRMLNIEFIFNVKNNPCPSIRDLYHTVPTFSSLISLSKPYIVLKDPGEIYQSLKNLIMELDDKQPGKDVMMYLLFAQVLLGISRLTDEALAIESPIRNLYIKKAISYLHQHYDQDIKIGEIAHKLNIHEGYLYRVFKNHMNITPIEYLTKLRIEKAKMLLTHTDIPIIEISGYIGVNSRQYFSYLFKKYTGTTPSKYRDSVDKHRISE